MPRTCKIDQLGLSDTVQQLMVEEGITTRAAMTAVLRERYNADVSEATVGRYLARIRNAAAGEAFQKIQEHVNRTVPADLDALEEMERQCLAWSREAGRDQVDRVAEAAQAIAGELDTWREMLLADADTQTTVRRIIRRAVKLIAADDRRQEQRLAAMRMVHKIIETKLSKAGLLDDEQKGRIVLLQQHINSAAQNSRGDCAPGPGRLLLVKGGCNEDG